MNTRNVLLVGVFLGVTLPAQAISQTADGLVLGKEDGYAMLGALATGGVAFGALHLLQPERLSGNGRKLFVSGVSAMLGGGLTYLVAKYLLAKDRTNIENYIAAEKALESVGESLLLKTPLDTLQDFIVEHYGTTEPFGHALHEIKRLESQLHETYVSLETLLKNIKASYDRRKRKLYEKGQKLFQEMKEMYTALLKRKTILSGERDYEESVRSLFASKQQVEEILLSEQLVAVKDSYEKTIAYGISSTNELWPLVTVIGELRQTVAIMGDVLKYCIAERETCLQKSVGKDRYKTLADGYADVMVRIKKEFPFDLFEQRIAGIFSSPEYQRQGQLLEKQKRHEETMNVLRGMQKAVENTLGDVKKTVSQVKKEVERTKNRLESVASKVSGLSWDTSSVRSDLSNVRSDVSTVKSDISRLRNDVSYIRNNIRQN